MGHLGLYKGFTFYFLLSQLDHHLTKCTLKFVTLYCTGGVDSFMMRVDMVVMNATSIPEWSINNEIFGMKLCRLIGLEKVRGVSLR